MRSALALLAAAACAQPLPNTQPLTGDSDPAREMIAGMSRWLLRETARTPGKREPSRERLRYLTGVVEDLSFRSVVSRIARLLLDLAVVQEGSAPVPRLTQEEMATMVGSVRDVVGRALRTLEKSGAIKLEGQRLLVIDPEKLRTAS